MQPTNDNTFKSKSNLETGNNLSNTKTTGTIKSNEQQQEQLVDNAKNSATQTINKQYTRTTFAEQFNRPSLHEQLYGTTTASAAATAKSVKNNNNNNTRLQINKQQPQQQQQEQQIASIETKQMTASPFLPKNVSNQKFSSATAVTEKTAAMPLNKTNQQQLHVVAMTTKSCDIYCNEAKSNSPNAINENQTLNVDKAKESANVTIALHKQHSLEAIPIKVANATADIANAYAVVVPQKRVNFDLSPTQKIENKKSATSSDSDNEDFIASIVSTTSPQLQQQQQQLSTNAILPYQLSKTIQFLNKADNVAHLQKQQQQQQQKRQHDLKHKNIVFNGTFPIDLPLQAPFKYQQRSDYDPEANFAATRLKYEYGMQDIDEEDEINDDDDEDEDDDEDDDLDEENEVVLDRAAMAVYDSLRRQHCYNDLGVVRDTKASSSKRSSQSSALSSTTSSSAAASHKVWSVQELIENPTIPLNYQKMCREVEQSLAQFEEYLDAKAGSSNIAVKGQKQKVSAVRTFDIDCPIEANYYHRDNVGSGAVKKNI